MDGNFLSFADRVLVALAEHARSEGPHSAPDLHELCSRCGIPFEEAWIAELPRYLEQQGWATSETTMQSRRARIRGAGLARAAELSQANEADALLEAATAPVPSSALSPDKRLPAFQPVAARFTFLFREAADQLPQHLKATYYDHSGKGLLQSGATIKRTAQIANDLCETAVASALEAVSTATTGPGRKRSKLLDNLRSHVEGFFQVSSAYISGDLERFRLEPNLLMPLLQQAKEHRLEQIEQYRAGWTAPAPRSFKDRHPTLHDVLLALVSGLIGAALALLVQHAS